MGLKPGNLGTNTEGISLVVNLATEFDRRSLGCYWGVGAVDNSRSKRKDAQGVHMWPADFFMLRKPC